MTTIAGESFFGAVGEDPQAVKAKEAIARIRKESWRRDMDDSGIG